MKQQSELSKAKIVCFGEILMRLAAPRPQMLLQRDILEPMICAAEANVVYDRASSSFAELNPTRIDSSKLIERAEWLFADGITAALGDGPITTPPCGKDAKRMRLKSYANFRCNLISSLLV